MIHWAMVETLALFGKRMTQIITCSFASKNFTTTLAYALQILDGYYKKCLLEIKEQLKSEPIIALVLDNFCKVVQHRVQKNNQSVIIHHATALSCMRHKVTALPQWAPSYAHLLAYVFV